MKKSLFVFLFILGQVIYPTFMFGSDSLEQEFLPYETDQYFYTVSTEILLLPGATDLSPFVISDTTKQNYFNNGKHRILITQETKDGKIITKTEEWKTKHPSYLNKENGKFIGSIRNFLIMYFALICVCTKYELEVKIYPQKLDEAIEKSLEAWILEDYPKNFL